MTSPSGPSSHLPSTLLITGAPGWLCDALIASIERSPLAGIDRIRCFIREGVEHERAELARRWGSGVEIVEGDVTVPASLTAAMHGVAAVVHGAAVIHVEHTREYYEINTQGTRNVAQAAAAAGAKRFVYISTNAAGGRTASADTLMTESDVDRPLSAYGHSKRLAELLLMDVPGPMVRSVLRPCMFYGPPVPPRHVEIYRRIRSGWMPLVGGGGYRRSLTHIDNLVQAVRLALTRANADRQTYYVADADPYTTRGVVDAMARALGVKPRYLHLPAFAARAAYAADRVLARQGLYAQAVHLVGEADWNVGVSIEKARRELGYEPRVAIDEGMRQAVEWCRDRALL